MVALILQMPRFIEDRILPVCIAISLNITGEIEGQECDCVAAPLGHKCMYQTVVRNGMLGGSPWVTYVILTELMLKILPSILLLILNFLMAERYYQAVERRAKLRASSFVSGSSQLMSVENYPTVERSFDKKRTNQKDKKQTLAQGCSQKAKSPRVGVGKGLRTFSSKDKSLLLLLFTLTIVFIITNIPMAVVRIMTAFDKFIHPILKCVVNVLELSFASTNFYLYCLCNERIRKKVAISAQLILHFIQAFSKLRALARCFKDKEEYRVTTVSGGYLDTSSMAPRLSVAFPSICSPNSKTE